MVNVGANKNSVWKSEIYVNFVPNSIYCFNS